MSFWDFPINNIRDLLGVISDFIGLLVIIVGGIHVRKNNNSYFPKKNYKNNNSYFPKKNYKNNIVKKIIIKDNKGVIIFNK